MHHPTVRAWKPAAGFPRRSDTGQKGTGRKQKEQGSGQKRAGSTQMGTDRGEKGAAAGKKASLPGRNAPAGRENASPPGKKAVTAGRCERPAAKYLPVGPARRVRFALSHCLTAEKLDFSPLPPGRLPGSVPQIPETTGPCGGSKPGCMYPVPRIRAG